MSKKKTYTRYLVVKIDVEVDADFTDQNPDDHIAEIAREVTNNLDYNVAFDGLVAAGGDANNAIEVPVKITDTEIVNLLDKEPL